MAIISARREQGDMEWQESNDGNVWRLKLTHVPTGRVIERKRVVDRTEVIWFALDIARANMLCDMRRRLEAAAWRCVTVADLAEPEERPHYAEQTCANGHRIGIPPGAPLRFITCGMCGAPYVTKNLFDFDGTLISTEDISPAPSDVTNAVNKLREASEGAQRLCALVRTGMRAPAVDIWRAAADYAESQATRLEATRSAVEGPEACRRMAEVFREAADELDGRTPQKPS